MENSSLIELIRSLTTKELKSFKAFASLPLHSPERYPKEALILLNLLIRHAPDYQHPSLEKAKVYEKLFPGGDPEDGRLERVITELQKCLRNFLLYERYFHEAQGQQAQLDFARILLERNLPQRAGMQIKMLQNTLEGKPSKTNEEMATLYNLSRLEYQVESRKNTWRKDLNIRQMLRSQDLHFLADRINILLHFLMLSKISKVEPHINLSAERAKIEDFEVSIEESLDVFVAKRIFDLYEDVPGQQTFEAIFDLLKEHEDRLNKEDIKQYYTFLRNHCALSLYAGNTELLPVLHDIQRDNLAKGYFYHGGKILPGAFFTISNAALMTQNFAWASGFVEEHRDRIIGDNETRDYYRLGLANLLFHQGAYDAAIEQVPAAFPNLDYHQAARRLELMIYYETNSDLLPYKISAYKMYLSRNHHTLLSKESYEMNLGFINILNQLSQAAPWDTQQGEKILQRIGEKKQLVAKEWLIQKAKKLAKK